ncbi:MAG: DUF4349 domain-containing protein [Nitrospira sp.]|nr:DUF4349 domain-containing protein [Nitrospira sp.]
MSTPLQIITLLCAGYLAAGCVATSQSLEDGSVLLEAPERSSDHESTADIRPDRLLVWKTSLTIEVSNVSDGMRSAIATAEQFKGYVEQQSERGDESASVRLRVPSESLKSAVGALEGLGTVKYRRIAGEDVTERYIDTEARLKNKIELRDRLRQLLQKATDVKDVLAIETELNRVQSDIDAMEGKLKRLKSGVAYATIDLDLRREKILGPLGYVLKGLWWGVEKLFFIRS